MGDRMGRSTLRSAGLGAVLLLVAVASPSRAEERLNELLDSGELEGVADPVPVNYLLNEGRGKLDAELEAIARDQLMTALRVQTSPMVAMLAGVQGGMNAPTMQGIRERSAKQMSGAGMLKSTVGAMLGMPGIGSPPPPAQQEVAQAMREMQQGLPIPGSAASRRRTPMSCSGTRIHAPRCTS